MKLLKMILSHLKKLDYVLIAAVLFLSAFGLLMVYSAGYPLGYMKYHDGSYFFMKQLQWLLIGLAFFSLPPFSHTKLTANSFGFW